MQLLEPTQSAPCRSPTPDWALSIEVPLGETFLNGPPDCAACKNQIDILSGRRWPASEIALPRRLRAVPDNHHKDNRGFETNIGDCKSPAGRKSLAGRLA